MRQNIQKPTNSHYTKGLKSPLILGKIYSLQNRKVCADAANHLAQTACYANKEIKKIQFHSWQIG